MSREGAPRGAESALESTGPQITAGYWFWLTHSMESYIGTNTFDTPFDSRVPAWELAGGPETNPVAEDRNTSQRGYTRKQSERNAWRLKEPRLGTMS